MVGKGIIACAAIAMFAAPASAFVTPSSGVTKLVSSSSAVCLSVEHNQDGSESSSRRDLINKAALFGIGTFVVVPAQALASGGATAGGVYLLSAKQRYNERVVKGVKAFLALSNSLEAGSLDETKAFFVTQDEGGWFDSSKAGYLLSNAFRRSSSTPPDSLPSVKKWKAFQAQVESLEKSIKKKDAKGALAAYNKAVELLDAYLDAVELPPTLELR